MQRIIKGDKGIRSRKMCSVPQCSTYGNSVISLHKFPLNPKEAKKWKILLKIGKPISNYMLVCSKHFVKNDFFNVTSKTQRKRLKNRSLPSQNLPVLKHSGVKKERSNQNIYKDYKIDAAYSQSLFDQISRKNLEGVTSIKVTPVPLEREETEGKKFWTDEEIKQFLKIYHKYKLFTNSGSYDNKIWIRICTDLAKKGIKKSPERCRQKWKNLLRSYKLAVNSKLTTKFPYVQQISSILYNDAPSIDITGDTSSDESEGSKDDQQVSESKREIWSRYEILKFLKVFQRYRKDRPKYKTEKYHWDFIAQKLREEGVFKPAKKLHTKWKNLYQSYKVICLKNRPPIKFEFFYEVKNLLEGRELPERDSDGSSYPKEIETNYTSWTGEETLRLIEMYKQHKLLFSQLPKKAAWDIVSADLQCEGIKKDSDKCENKWKNLIRSYKRNKSHSNSRFYFFNEMKMIFEDEDEGYLDEAETSQMIKADEEEEEEEDDEEEEEDDEEEFTYEEMDAEEVESNEDIDDNNYEEEIIIETNTDHNYSWSKEEIIALVTSYTNHNRNKNIPKDSTWKLVSGDMQLRNFERTSEECKKMYETLLAEYTKHKESDTLHSFPFFKDIDTILSKNVKENVKHHELCKCFEKRAMDKERRHVDRMQMLKRKMEIEDRKVTAFEKYVNHLTDRKIMPDERYI